MNKLIKTLLFCGIAASALLAIFAFRERPQKLELAVSQEVNGLKLKTEGKFPDWLHGQFIRNSAVAVYLDGKQVSDPYDGLAMLHSFSIEDGQVHYSNRFLPTQAYDDVVNKGRIDYRGLTTKPSHWHQFLDLFSPAAAHCVKNASVNVSRMGSHAVSLTEVPLPIIFDRKTALVSGEFQYEDLLPTDKTWVSPHPHRNEEDQAVYNIMIEFGHPCYYILYKVKDGSSKREVIAKIPVEKPAYMHSFSITEHYLVLTEYPLLMPKSYLKTPGKPFLETFCKWDSTKKTHFILVEKDTGKVALEADTEPFFSFHHVNAFESEGGVILDLIAYPSFHDSHPASWSCRLLRHHLFPQQISTEILLENKVEFPRINETLDGKPYRYLYAILYDADALVKFDTETKTAVEWKVPGQCPIEPVFVPKPGSDKEDDGIVLTVINSEEEHKGYVVALDGRTLKEVARAQMPWMLPTTFHGQFFAESDFVAK